VRLAGTDRGGIAAHLDSADVSREPLIAPSLLSADFARLAEESHRVADADWLHFDVMDAHFVPNLTFGLPVMQAVQAVSPVPLDCHLMIENPDRWAPGYAEAGARNVTVHAEACTDPRAVARDIRAAGALAGLALKPGTPLEDYLEVLTDFDTLLVMTVEPGFGGQSFIADVLPKVRQAAAAGADVFVAGSAVYGAEDPSKAIAALRAQAAAAMHG
jgi:ribulose-phosphate 3-epimerase